MASYYNEIDPYAAQWLRNLIAAGHIAPGDVDERDIRDIKPNEIRGYTQCHFFAGVGVWSYALRLAGWPDDKPVWTGSCPCQPFSSAGMARGFADERHLWPFFHFLIEECGPGVVFGEQVASKDGLAWFDLVQTDLEAAGYACGAVDLCAAGVGAPHIRQRLWFVAERLADLHADGLGEGREGEIRPATETGESSGLADAEQQSSECKTEATNHQGKKTDRPANRVGGCSGVDGGLADAESKRCRKKGKSVGRSEEWASEIYDNAEPTRPTDGFWRDADWLFCRDGKWRPVESGTFPLAHGASQRVGRLRAYGNAINTQAAKEVIASYMECRP